MDVSFREAGAGAAAAECRRVFGGGEVADSETGWNVKVVAVVRAQITIGARRRSRKSVQHWQAQRSRPGHAGGHLDGVGRRATSDQRSHLLFPHGPAF